MFSSVQFQLTLFFEDILNLNDLYIKFGRNVANKPKPMR